MKVFIVALVSLCVVVTTQGAGCPPAFKDYGNSCYKFSADLLEWSAALAACTKIGAVLAEVESEAETNFLEGIAKSNKQDYWLGGTDSESEGNWIWGYSRQPIEYTHWSPTNPDNYRGQRRQNCLQLWAYADSQWDDDFCTIPKKYICEIRKTCPEGWSYFGNSCYKLSSDKFNFEDAKNKCRRENAYLSEVYTAAENNYLVRLVSSTNTDFWLGGSDAAKEGDWKWASDGASIQFTDWTSDNPNNAGGKQNCLQLWAARKFKWDDDFCSEVDKYICEMMVVCPPGWRQFGSSCYKFSDDKKAWTAAQSMCKGEGGYLAEVESRAETDYLEGVARPTGTDYWLGGTDAGNEGDWKWANSQTDFNFVAWSPKNPDNYKGSQNCLQLWAYSQSRWDDDFCNIEKKYICEISSIQS